MSDGRRDANIRRCQTHGHAKKGKVSLTYKRWNDMHYRVRTDPDYTGVTVCDRWARFENFLIDMGEAPVGLSLDRKNPLGNYEPSNCRWADMKQQQNNRTNNRMETYQGRTQTLAMWADEIGIPYKTLYSRVNQYGWTIDKALTTPVRSYP